MLQPETTRTAAFRADVASLRPEVFAVVAYGHLLGPRLLELAPRAAYNLHFSLLPRWRGAAPVQRAILAGDTVTGACVIRLVHAMDAGPVIASVETPIALDEHAPALEARLAIQGAGLLVRARSTLSRPARRERSSRMPRS